MITFQINYAFMRTIWVFCVRPSLCSYTCSDFVAAQRTDEALFSFWKPQEMGLNSILSWGPHSKSHFIPYFLQHVMDVTSERQTWPHRPNNNYTYILCPLLCQSKAPMWDMFEPNVILNVVTICSVFFSVVQKIAWLEFKLWSWVILKLQSLF